MERTRTPFFSIIFWLLIIGIDVAVYMVLGILQKDYDDNYDDSQGEYWSLASMNKRQLFYYLAFQLWNFLNFIGLIYVGRTIYRRFSTGQ
jgi:hypothetical protein